VLKVWSKQMIPEESDMCITLNYYLCRCIAVSQKKLVQYSPEILMGITSEKLYEGVKL
jgi:hypothetical protein